MVLYELKTGLDAKSSHHAQSPMTKAAIQVVFNLPHSLALSLQDIMYTSNQGDCTEPDPFWLSLHGIMAVNFNAMRVGYSLASQTPLHSK